jgi:hypothetical protein
MDHVAALVVGRMRRMPRMKSLMKLNRILQVKCEREMPDVHEAYDQQTLPLINLPLILTRIQLHTWN